MIAFGFSVLGACGWCLLRMRTDLVGASEALENQIKATKELRQHVLEIVQGELENLARVQGEIGGQTKVCIAALEETIRLLSEKGANTQHIQDENASSASGQPGPETKEQLEELKNRLRIAEDIMAEKNKDPELRDLVNKYTSGDSSPQFWSVDLFTRDPNINPSGIVLSESEKAMFSLRFAVAKAKINHKDVERQMVTQQAILDKLQGGGDGSDGTAGGLPENVIVASQFGGTSVVLTEDECPLIKVLVAEREPIVLNWAKEARDFFAHLKR